MARTYLRTEKQEKRATALVVALWLALVVGIGVSAMVVIYMVELLLA